MYQNQHARFTAVDPLLASGKSANPQTFNRYVYVVNNPLIFVDPDGLQVATAAGKVYINRAGTQVAIFDGKPRKGFVPLDRSIETTTRIGKATHHLSVTPNGWTVGDRVDGSRFTAPAASPPQGPPVESAAIRQLSREVVNGLSDAATGIGKGIVNSPSVAWNGVTTGIFNGGPQAFYFRGSNPFAAPNILEYSNAREASYGSAGSTAAVLAPSIVMPVFAGGSAPLSVVPQFPRISTPYGVATQSLSPEAIAAREAVEGGAVLYRRGTLGTSQTSEAQFWSLQHPMGSNYAAQSGLPSSSTRFNFIEAGRLNPGQTFVTRPAPGVGTNPGGGVEVVTNPSAVRICYFSTC